MAPTRTGMLQPSSHFPRRLPAPGEAGQRLRRGGGRGGGEAAGSVLGTALSAPRFLETPAGVILC